jgi:hypothetical protein
MKTERRQRINCNQYLNADEEEKKTGRSKRER